MTDHPHDTLEPVEEFEEFDNEEFENHAPPPQGLGAKLGVMWRDNPGFKMMVILGGGLLVMGAVYLLMNNNSKPAVTQGAAPSHVAQVENVKGTVGADVTPEYKDLLQKSNKEKATEALQTGQSSIPTPVGNVTNTEAPKKEEPVDPLAMWKQAEQQKPAPLPTQNAQQANNQQVQAQQQEQQDLAQRSNAIQTQINTLMQAWAPTQATVVSFSHTTTSTTAAANANGQNETTNANGAAATAASTQQQRAKVIVPAGDILYGAMITEANSDVPGPILAQVMSGSLKGGRLIGQFQVSQDYLVLQFHLLSINGHSYSVNAIALDPNTTLGGMATETDQRYFSRLVLPAAASFISQFGQAISQPPQTTSVSNGTVVVSQGQETTKDALYAGAGQAAQQVANFVQAAGNTVKPLVRVASNTPIGIFFTAPVTDQPQDR